jgi:hypothetical protein
MKWRNWANEYIAKTNNSAIVKLEESNFGMVRERVVCNDGFAFSLQASRYHYCSPRETGLESYTHVELGYPTEGQEELMEYAEDISNPCDTVYGWVPTEVVDFVIMQHGGIKDFD